MADESNLDTAVSSCGSATERYNSSMHARLSYLLALLRTIARFLVREVVVFSPVLLLRALTFLAVALTIAALASLSIYKVFDRDFWWHVKAGQVMGETKQLIQTEPFAYTREGQPYLATYEWLAQVALAFIFQQGGAAGVIAFRVLMISAAFLLVLAIDLRRAWCTGFFIVGAAVVAQIVFLERPQLFTFLFFAADLWLATRILDLPDAGSPNERRRVFWYLGTWLAIQVLWVNTHGAASVLGWLIGGALVAQKLFTASARHDRAASVRFWLIFAFLLLLATLLSPNHIHVFTYLQSLLTDKTIAFIYEWQPRPMSVYLPRVGPFWILALVSLWLARRRMVWSALVLVATAYLSLKAVRHEILFLLAASAVSIYQWKDGRAFDGFAEWFFRRQHLALFLFLLSAFLIGRFAHATTESFLRRDHLYGIGTFDLARGAVDFLEREHLEGKMFNTYGIGGYLLYRGYPQRKVYIDGRNVDYGFAFLNKTFYAGFDENIWQELEKQYGFTYALIDYDALKAENRIPYVQHLEKNPSWVLVYLDDWVAIYVKDIPLNAPLIAKHRFQELTVSDLEFGRLRNCAEIASLGFLAGNDEERELSLRGASETSDEAISACTRFATELRRAINSTPQAIKARLALAELSMRVGRRSDARTLINEARTLRPFRAEVHALDAALLTQEERWAEAGEAYERMLRAAGESFPNIRYEVIADVFAKAHNTPKEQKYRRLAERASTHAFGALPSPNTDAASEQKKQNLLEELRRGFTEDVQKFNDDGIALAERGDRVEAREALMNALKLDPGAPLTLNNLAALSLEEGKFSEAIGYLERALERAPGYADAHYNLALAYARSGEKHKAREHAQKAREQGRDIAPLEHFLR